VGKGWGIKKGQQVVGVVVVVVVVRVGLHKPSALAPLNKKHTLQAGSRA